MKNNQVRFAIALFALLPILFGVASISRAQDDAPHEHLEAGWRKATELLDGVLTPEQHSEMNVLAFSAAVAGLCDGFSLDRDKFAKAMKMLEHEDKANMSAEQLNYYEHHLTFNYGVAVGLFLAEGSMDQADFCAAATAQRNDPETGLHYWE
jgi:hypothetical protein